MVILECAPPSDALLDFIDQSIRQLAESGAEARYILMGPAAFSAFRRVLAGTLHREEKDFSYYNYLPVVLDPFRMDAVCVVPGPGACAAGVQPVRI